MLKIRIQKFDVEIPIRMQRERCNEVVGQRGRWVVEGVLLRADLNICYTCG